MSGKYIECEALKEAFEEDGHLSAYIEEMIDDSPAADVVEVVRCADCKHAEPWYWDKSRCFLWHETGIDVRNDGYCNYGERKDGGQDE